MAKIKLGPEVDKRWGDKLRCGVQFTDGEGESRDEAVLAFFERHGYRVERRRAQRPQESQSSQERGKPGDAHKGDGENGAQNGAQGSEKKEG